jgi:hypothetical protein
VPDEAPGTSDQRSLWASHSRSSRERCNALHFPDQGFEPRILPCQAGFALALFVDLKGSGRMGQKLVAPLIILGLPGLTLCTEFRSRCCRSP